MKFLKVVHKLNFVLFHSLKIHHHPDGPVVYLAPSSLEGFAPFI